MKITQYRSPPTECILIVPHRLPCMSSKRFLERCTLLCLRGLPEILLFTHGSQQISPFLLNFNPHTTIIAAISFKILKFRLTNHLMALCQLLSQ